MVEKIDKFKKELDKLVSFSIHPFNKKNREERGVDFLQTYKISKEELNGKTNYSLMRAYGKYIWITDSLSAKYFNLTTQDSLRRLYKRLLRTKGVQEKFLGTHYIVIDVEGEFK